MNLKRYLAFVQDLLYARRDVTLEDIFIEETEPEYAGIIEGRLRYWDGSLFKFVEQLVLSSLRCHRRLRMCSRRLTRICMAARNRS